MNKNSRRDKPKIDRSDPVQLMFEEVSTLLDARHDRRERIVKLSRDITIASKRIIFSLHRIKSDSQEDEDRKAVLAEVETRLEETNNSLWRQVSGELKGEDHYQFLRAYSPGLQEWVEAYTFFYYLKHNTIAPYETIQTKLKFDDGACVTVPQSEYILGLADLTGELMRNAINALGAGNMEVCFVLLEILQSMAEGFGQMPKQDTPRDFGQKLWTLKQSCKKVESACYAISVRGSEIPKNHWADIFVKREDDDRRDGGGYEESFFST